MQPDYKKVKLITGYSIVENSKLIGYCHCDAHPGYLTPNLYHNHNCECKNSGKPCSFLQKYDCSYFQHQEKFEAYRASKKADAKEEKEKKRNLRKKMETLRLLLQEFLADEDVTVTSVRSVDGVNTVFFVNNDGKPCDEPLKFVQVKKPDGSYAAKEDIIA